MNSKLEHEFDFKDEAEAQAKPSLTLGKIGVTAEKQVIASERKYEDTLAKAEKSLKAIYKGTKT